MKKIVLLVMLAFISCFILDLSAQDTFSIIAVDPETGEIGSAGATCVDGIADLGGIKLLNTIIPGRGGVNAQAYICINPHINLNNAIGQMETGSAPEEIIEWLKNNDGCQFPAFNVEYRQYGIVDFAEDGSPRTAAFTGDLTDDYKGHLTGETYAIQGNILLGPEVLEGMENGFLNTEGSLAEKLMAAMQGANIAGADVRCLNRGTSSTSAFLRVVKPDDAPDAPFLELDVLEMPFGEEPIDSLQTLFDEWIATSVSDIQKQLTTLKIFPNPTTHEVRIESNGSPLVELAVYNSVGTLIRQRDLPAEWIVSMETANFPAGLYYLVGKGKDGKKFFGKLIKNRK